MIGPRDLHRCYAKDTLMMPGGRAQVVEYLCSNHKALNSNPRLVLKINKDNTLMIEMKMETLRLIW
jgi:hypothetical protein